MNEAPKGEDAASPPRIVVVANKYWEADPLVNVLLSDRARPSALTNFAVLNHPARAGEIKPRITFTCQKAAVEVWCVQDLMDPKANSSSSAEKARVLPAVFAKPANLVIAFGTAGFPDAANLNGSAVIGSRCFVHDPPTATTPRFNPKLKDAVSTSGLPQDFFRNMDNDVRFAAEGRFLPAPIEPARPARILAGHNWIALGSVNVTSYDDYVWTDAETIETFKKVDPKTTAGRIGSMETTHGIIRETSAPAKFLFVSGITDTVPYFDLQVTPRVYAQNFVAAHNAAVTVAWLIPEVVAQLGFA